MFWLLHKPEHIAIVDEISKQKDRSAAIVAAAFVESLLESVLRMRLADNVDIQNKMFKGSGPLATFSAKIDLALLLNELKPRLHKELHNIREIRNEFAHNPTATSFKFQRINGLCKNFPAPVKINIKRELDKEAFERIKEKFGDQYPAALATLALVEPQNSRGRFMAAIKRFAVMFSIRTVLLNVEQAKSSGQPASPEKRTVHMHVRPRTGSRKRKKPTPQPEASLW